MPVDCSSGIIELNASVSQLNDLTQANAANAEQSSASDAELRDGDRLEIYRPLLLDPMQARRLRAQRQRN